MKRHATAVWNGSGKEGKGHLTTQSTTLDQTQYSFNSRFAEGVGTNPEELIAAAHAGCFSMKLSFNLSEAGFVPDEIQTKATVNFENGEIVEITLDVNVKAPGLEIEKFNELAQDAKQNCPVSKVLNTKITMNAQLA